MIIFEPISPLNGDIDIPINAEIVLRIYDDTLATLDLSTLNIAVQDKAESHFVIRNGEFYDDWDGEILITSNSDITIVLIRHSSDPFYPFGSNIYITAEIESESYNYSFYTRVRGFAYPPSYDQESPLTSLPAGWTTGGTAPAFGPSGMQTAAGDSYIIKSFSLNADLSEMIIDTRIDVSGPATGTAKVLEVVNHNNDIVSVYVDFQNLEIWLDNMAGMPLSGFRPVIKETGITFRLSIKNVGSNLIAKLYVKSSTLTTRGELPYLQQTLGPSLGTPSTNYIKFGSIESPGQAIAASYFAYLLDDPDKYYALPKIKSVTPSEISVNGGEIVRVELEDYIDIGDGGEVFRDDSNFLDQSSGNAKVVVSNGVLSLIIPDNPLLPHVGTSKVRMVNSYTGDIPSGVEVGLNITTEQSAIDNPPPTEVILFGMEVGVNGDTAAIEMVSDSINKTYFRVKQTYAINVISTTKLANTLQNTHTLSFIRSSNKLVFLLNNAELYTVGIGDGIGRLILYTNTTTPLSITTEVTNFQVRPVIAIGDKVAVI